MNSMSTMNKAKEIILLLYDMLAVLLGSIKCMTGMHEWKLHTYVCKHGHAVGDKCMRCGRWHKSATRVAK